MSSAEVSQRATIYIAYHKQAPIYAGKPLVPIHVGRALASSNLPDMIGDDTGDNISARNPCYCELTAHYWAWKNDHDSSFIGLMHYRRFLEAVPALAAQPERFAPYLNADAFAGLGTNLRDPSTEWLFRHPAGASAAQRDGPGPLRKISSDC
ncbi:DUF4422 domain-containing protein [Mesorhizobium quangtriensis]|uniref:DUF4422 domain-containing protein n=1 Tax=Mesorhizobium quangtriensis TaxID=3157709 RepID=UPI003CCE2539